MLLKDIAKKVNVSPSTVTLVLNNRDGVSADKRAQILQLLEDNGYETGGASGPRKKQVRKKTKIFFVKYKVHSKLVDGNPGFVNSIIDAVDMECRRQNCSLSLTVCSHEQLPALRDMINNESPDGILLLGTEMSEDDCSFLNDLKAPLVIIDSYLQFEDFNCITMNNYSAIYSSVNYLAELGHPRIGFLANSIPSNNCSERREAFQKAIIDKGLSFDNSLIYDVQPTIDGACGSLCKLLTSGVSFPSAIIANNDSIALGAMKAFKEYGLRIPDDISIVGFDNIPFSTVSDPPLTTIDVSCIELGIWAVRLLCDHISYPMSSSTKVRLSTRLLLRDSAAAYNGVSMLSAAAGNSDHAAAPDSQ